MEEQDREIQSWSNMSLLISILIYLMIGFNFDMTYDFWSTSGYYQLVSQEMEEELQWNDELVLNNKHAYHFKGSKKIKSTFNPTSINNPQNPQRKTGRPKRGNV